MPQGSFQLSSLLSKPSTQRPRQRADPHLRVEGTWGWLCGVLAWNPNKRSVLFQFPSIIMGKAGPAVNCLVLSEASPQGVSLGLGTASAVAACVQLPPSFPIVLAIMMCWHSQSHYRICSWTHTHAHARARLNLDYSLIMRQGWISSIYRWGN